MTVFGWKKLLNKQSQTAQCNLDTHTYVYTNIHRHQAPLGKHHHTSSQRSQLRKQQSLISVALLFNFLFVPNWKSEGSVFLSLLVRHKFFDIKHGLVVSKLSLTRHEWEKRGLELLSLLVEAIDFQATYALFVCTDTLECKPVKCEVLHLSPTGPCLIFFGLLSTQTRARVHKIQSGHFANQI